MLSVIIQAFWVIASAYAANAFPPLIRGKIPVDGNVKFKSQPLLGRGKTIEGTIAGILFGIFIGSLQLYFQNDVAKYVDIIPLSFTAIVLLSAGAVFGDMIGSFIKRRIGFERGKPAILLDQLDFLIFALISVSFALHLTLPIIIFLIVITPVIHYISNLIAYILDIKQTPW
ncbi:MAG: CDP-2,3-bis-(O-geranylgeranyl)-sn-glycerol synthase [Candidatus Aenigmarchaeota archaeon]|nr:CDP-2,3-bis-(O-geranylgeranyl)-sn-glycerol synthase [Candidatus Aenigmarchaeota archaeon]